MYVCMCIYIYMYTYISIHILIRITALNLTLTPRGKSFTGFFAEALPSSGSDVPNTSSLKSG